MTDSNSIPFLNFDLNSVTDFLSSQNFLIPFLATLGASLTVIIIERFGRIRIEKKKKIYALAYMSDALFRLLLISITMKKHTIIPHITAIKKIISGDDQLLDKIFSMDDFDILTDKPIKFDHLPREYKILLGYDDITLVQMYETLGYLSENDKTKDTFNHFTKENLKSRNEFCKKSDEDKKDVLENYLDYLERIEHEENRALVFIVEMIYPKIKEYIRSPSIWLYSKKSIRTSLEKIEYIKNQNVDIIPNIDYMENKMRSGTQNLV